MSDAQMALVPYIILTIDGMITALVFATTVVMHIRPRVMLVGSAAMAVLAVWFALLAITAGTDPLVKRGDIAPVLRSLGLIAGLVWSAWIALYARGMIVIQRKRGDA